MRLCLSGRSDPNRYQGCLRKRPVNTIAMRFFLLWELIPRIPMTLPKVGLAGGQMTSIFKACGAVGVVTNGPSRDVDEIRPMKFQYIMSGVTAGHGPFAISAINIPVSVSGMDVAPGEIIHMDENGACKFPADRLADVCKNIDALAKAEEERANALRAAKSIEEVKEILSGKRKS